MKFKRFFNFFKKNPLSAVAIKFIGNATPIWSDKNYQNFANEAYLKNVIAYRCINIIAKSVGSVDWKVFQKSSDGKRELVENHPVNKILKRPNPGNGFSFFMQEAQAFLSLDGNSFLHRIAPTTGPNKGIPQELHVLRPDRIKMLKANGKVVGYEYTAADNIKHFFEIDPITQQADLLQIKNFHPLNDYWGASPIEPSAREIDTSNAGTQWNKSLLDNEARPGMIIITKGNLEKGQREFIKEQFKRDYAGPQNSGESLLLEGEDMKVEKYGFSPNELDFIEGGRELARRICMAHEVPPQLLGIKGDSTFANFEQAQLFFWENTVFYFLKLWKTELNNWIFPEEDNFFLDFVLEDIPALAPKRNLLWERAEKSTFITTNEKREMVGMEKVDNGDVVLVPASMIPLDSSIDDEQEDEEKKSFDKLLSQGFSVEEANEMLGN